MLPQIHSTINMNCSPARAATIILQHLNTNFFFCGRLRHNFFRLWHSLWRLRRLYGAFTTQHLTVLNVGEQCSGPHCSKRWNVHVKLGPDRLGGIENDLCAQIWGQIQYTSREVLLGCSIAIWQSAVDVRVTLPAPWSL